MQSKRGAVANVAAMNQRAMASEDAISIYVDLCEELTPPERAMLAAVKDEARGGAILDLGVGAGRTVAALLELSEDYIGIDYVPEMVEVCQRRFPHAYFRCADARDLSMFADGAFRLVVFSCNGVCMVGHADRQRILREASRVLADNGLFVFSTYNRRSSHCTDTLVLPKLVPDRNPVRTAWRAIQVARAAAQSLYNRARYSRLEQREASYALINDRCHNYGTMLYYVDIAEQRRQLADAGFAPDARAFGMQGQAVRDDTTESSVAFIARKAPKTGMRGSGEDTAFVVR